MLLDICRSRFRCRRCRGHRCHGFPAQAKLFRQGGALLGIGRGGKWMIASQSPPPSIFVSGQAVADSEVSSQSLSTIAAIETNHVVMAHRLPDRHSRIQNLFLNLLSKLAECPMY